VPQPANLTICKHSGAGHVVWADGHCLGLPAGDPEASRKLNNGTTTPRKRPRRHSFIYNIIMVDMKRIITCVLAGIDYLVHPQVLVSHRVESASVS